MSLLLLGAGPQAESSIPASLYVSLKAAWQLSNALGGDSSGNGNTLTVNGSGLSTFSGVTGTATQTDGTSSMSRASGVVTTGALSVSLWYYLASDNNSTQAFWGQEDESNVIGLRFTSNRGSRCPQIILNVAGTGTSSIINVGFTLATWHHAVMTYDGAGTGKLYVDGVYVNTVSATADYGANTALMTFPVSGQTLKSGGAMQLVYEWNKALTDGGVALNATAGGEVALLYNNGAGLSLF